MPNWFNESVSLLQHKVLLILPLLVCSYSCKEYMPSLKYKVHYMCHTQSVMLFPVELLLLCICNFVCIYLNIEFLTHEKRADPGWVIYILSLCLSQHMNHILFKSLIRYIYHSKTTLDSQFVKKFTYSRHLNASLALSLSLRRFSIKCLYSYSGQNAWQSLVAYDACFRLCLNAWARGCMEAPEFLRDECLLLRNAFGYIR